MSATIANAIAQGCRSAAQHEIAPRLSAIECAGNPADVANPRTHVPTALESHGWNQDWSTTEKSQACSGWASVAAWLLVRHRGATVSAWRDLVRAFRPVAVHFALYAIWIGAVTYVGARLGLWDGTLLKDTVLWTLLSGLGLLASTTDAMQRDDWFRRTMIASVGATAVLEFVDQCQVVPAARRGATAAGDLLRDRATSGRTGS